MGIIISFLTYIRPSFLRRRVEYPSSLQDVCEDNLRNLDESVVKHLRSLETMQATAEELYNSFNNVDTDNGPLNDRQEIRGYKATAARLLTTITKTMDNERMELLSSLRSFLNFVMLNGGGPFKSDTSRAIELTINAYASDPNGLHFTEDDYIKGLQNENEVLNRKNEDYSMQVKTVQNECEELKSKLEEERNNSKRSVEHVEKENTKLKGKTANLQKQLKQSSERQTAQLQKVEEDIKEIAKEKTALHKEMSNRQSEHTKSQKQKESLINKLQEEVASYKALANSFEDKIKKKENDVADLVREHEEEIVKLKQQIQQTIGSSENEKVSQRSKFDQSLKEKEWRILELQHELRTVGKTVETYDHKIKELSNDVKRKEISLSELEQKIHEASDSARNDREAYENTLKVKDKKLTDLNKDLEKQISDKVKLIESHEAEKTLMTEEKKRLCTQRDKLSEELKMKTVELSSVQETVKGQNIEIQNVVMQVKEKEAILHGLRGEIDQKGHQIQTLQNECHEWGLKHEAALTRYQEIDAELSKIKGIMSVPVQLYCQQNTQWTSSLESNITEMLNTEMKSVDEKIELDIFKTTRPSDVKPDIPLLLFCVTISRIGTDVINATQGLNLTPNMAMIIFHHKDEHALPNQSSERILTGKEMTGSGGIFDMAFKSEKGIYQCEMNTKAIKSLVTFLRRQTKQTINHCSCIT